MFRNAILLREAALGTKPTRSTSPDRENNHRRDQTVVMASIYEKPSHFLLSKNWDAETSLPETYKLQSNDSLNKVKAEVHQDSGKLGAEFTVGKTIPDFNNGAVKISLDWTHSFTEFENVLQGQYKTAWKQVVHEFFPEPVDPSNITTEQDRSCEENFRHAIALFL